MSPGKWISNHSTLYMFDEDIVIRSYSCEIGEHRACVCEPRKYSHSMTTIHDEYSLGKYAWLQEITKHGLRKYLIRRKVSDSKQNNHPESQ